MDEEQEKAILEEIRTSRHLPYSTELVSVEGDAFILKNNWGNIIEYVKKGDKFFLKKELEQINKN